MATRQLQPRTPGAAPFEEPKAATVVATGDDGAADALVTEDPGGTAFPPDMQAMIDAAVARGIALAAQRSAAVNPAKPAEVLPDESEIDTRTIKSPVLTKQGYVVPEAYGTPAAALK